MRESHRECQVGDSPEWRGTVKRWNGTRGPLAELPTTYVRQLYVDALVFSIEALRHLVSVLGADRIGRRRVRPFPSVRPVRPARRGAGR